ncbi:hypothetical protein, partial [Vibrio coralliilyticus]
MLDIVLVTVSALVLVNVVVTISLLKNDSITSSQKLTQVSIVWMVPFIGAVGFGYSTASTVVVMHQLIKHLVVELTIVLVLHHKVIKSHITKRLIGQPTLGSFGSQFGFSVY